MERIQAEINWDYLEMNLTQELYQKIEDKLGNSGTIMTPYNLEILERWLREFPQIKTLTDLSGLQSAMKLQGKMELEILESSFANKMRADGITDMEMLDERGIDPFKFVKQVIGF
ncbi:MAG: hypothetical protein KTQ14_06570 [Fusobacteriaceae bacterium]|nr:hypothetical protein [Fusobacteriaceae bacterium]